MQVTIRKLQFLSVAVTTAFLVSLAPNSVLADLFIEHNYNQFMQSNTPSGPTYGNLRQEFIGKIRNARSEVDACGGCAGAQENLDALLAEEDQFQRAASRALIMAGAPPALFRLLGMSAPSFADYAASLPSSYESGEGLVNSNPDWLKDAPDFCQRPVRDYLLALKTYQDRAKSSEIGFLKSPGGEYYEESRIYRACSLKDYEEFARLMELRKARAAGQILAEIEPVGVYNNREKGTVYYGDVREDFMPPMPAAEIIRQSFADSGYREIRFVANKKQNDNLISTNVMPYSGVWLENKYDGVCHVPYAERPERVRRHCEDQNEIYRFTPYLLQCNYRTTGNFGMMARRFAFYWYDERVELAKIEYLLPRDHNHPLLLFLDPRTSCPATWQQASAELETYQASLDKQRGRIAEIPMTRSLPRSEWLLELIEAGNIGAERQRERMNVTKAYELPGYYAFDYKRVPTSDGRRARGDVPARPGTSTIIWADQPMEGDCIVAAYPGTDNPVYPVTCWTDSRTSIGKAVNVNGITFNFMPANQFLLDEQEADTLESDISGAKITLRRKRDLVPMGEVPLDGNYLLQLAFSGEYLRAHCTFDSSGGRDTSFQLNCIDDQGRYLQSSTMPYATYPTALMLRVGGFRHFPSWQAKYNARASSIMLGGAAIRKLFGVVDPAFEGDSPRDARVLLFGDIGIVGSLQRIERSETAFSDDDPANVTGHWVGDFQCGQTRDLKAELYLQDEGKGRFRDVSGTFVFRDSRYGEERVLSYAVAGQYISGVGSLKLDPGEWIKTVPQVGYESFGLRAAAIFTHADGAEGSARIVGDLTDKACADIQLSRVSRVVPESIVFVTQPDVASPIEEPDMQDAAAAAGTAESSSTGGAGPIIELAADQFVTGSLVAVTVIGFPGNSHDWVAISKAGQADNQYVSYKYTSGATQGTWKLKTGPPGDYEVRVYLNWPAGGYNPVLRRPITVVSLEEAADAGLISKPEIQLAARTFAPGQPIEVTVTGLPGNSQDWVAISRVGSADNKYQDYDYANGATEGIWTYTMNEPGDYEIRVYLNWPAGGYNPVVREPITVGGQH